MNGGLDLAVELVTGATTAWVSDIDKGANKILAHRYPDIPNLGDISSVDWSAVEPVDIITGGFPCQDVSHAGKRAGIKPGTRSGLWSQMAYAISELQPRMVVIENVRGLLSAEAHSDVEPCPWCVGDRPGGYLRALGAVLGGLADLGFDAEWRGLRAADVGACHGRFRVFVVAYAQHIGHEWDVGPRQRAGLPAVSSGTSGPLLPTPAVNDMGAGKTPEAWDEWTAKMQAAHANGNGHGKSLAIEALRLLPTPMAAEGTKPSNTMGVRRRSATGEVFLTNVIVSQFGDDPHDDEKEPTHGTFGQYADAIHRWEHTLGRPAPAPTEPTGRNDAHRLSPAFVEWMMGLPDGWVTGVPGITRNEALKALGNGVVPQQAEAALRLMLSTAVAACMSIDSFTSNTNDHWNEDVIDGEVDDD